MLGVVPSRERVSSLDELKRKLQKEGRAFTEPSKSSPPPFQLKAEQHPETATFTAPKGNGSTRKDGSPVKYKLHQSYAPPYLIITHYTDFAKTHGIVLLRGEITPTNSAAVDGSAGAADGRYMLNQTDAQLLAFGLQRFYLPTSPGGDVAGREAEELLRNFHERPAEFEWERLLKFANA
ncbi:hypothetical protein FRB99_002670, partial [Tulasnella sp. 403]